MTARGEREDAAEMTSCTELMQRIFPAAQDNAGSMPCLLKSRTASWPHKKRAGEVHIHHPLPLLEGEILKRGIELDARVVHEDVETTKLIHSTLKHAAHLLRIRHIRRHCDGPRAAAPHFLGHFERLVWLAEEIDDHVRSRMPKRDGDGPADAPVTRAVCPCSSFKTVQEGGGGSGQGKRDAKVGRFTERSMQNEVQAFLLRGLAALVAATVFAVGVLGFLLMERGGVTASKSCCRAVSQNSSSRP